MIRLHNAYQFTPKVVKLLNLVHIDEQNLSYQKEATEFLNFYHIPVAGVQEFIRFLTSLSELISVATHFPSVFEMQYY